MSKQTWFVLAAVIVIVTAIFTIKFAMGLLPAYDLGARGTVMETVKRSDRLSAVQILKKSDNVKFDNTQKTFFTTKNTPYEGEFIEHWRNGNIMCKINLSKGKVEGMTSFFYPNGKIKEEGKYKENLKHGTWTRYDENGKKWYEGKYTYGKKTGSLSIYDEDGSHVESLDIWASAE